MHAFVLLGLFPELMVQQQQQQHRASWVVWVGGWWWGYRDTPNLKLSWAVSILSTGTVFVKELWLSQVLRLLQATSS